MNSISNTKKSKRTESGSLLLPLANRTAQNSALGSLTIGGRGAVFSHFALTAFSVPRASLELDGQFPFAR